MAAPSPVVKSVAKKLKYYFEVRRLEDGFDLSDSRAPVLDHPPLKARSTLQYDGLHDRALKHYFSQPEVRVQLTQLGLVDAAQNPREQHIKKSLTHHMKRYHYLLTSPDLPPMHEVKVKNQKNSGTKFGKKPTIPACYYVYTNAGMKVHPSLVGFGAAPKSQKRKSLKGGWPLLRTTPPTNINRGEAERLVNSASKLLAATETVEYLERKHNPELVRQSHPMPFETDWELVKRKDPSLYVTESDGRSKQGRQPSGKRRPGTAKYTWDIHGHRVQSAKVKAYDDSYVGRVPRRTYLVQREASPSPSPSTTTEESERPPPKPLRPPSPPPAPPKRERPKSPKHRQRTVINMPDEKVREEVRVTREISPRKYEIGSQTERQLLDEYDHMEVEVKDGPWGEYQVYITTGNRIGASTSADVKITIYGEKGRTPALPLTNSKYNKVKFQRGKEDLFIVAARHVGKMRKIKIGHDRPQLSYAWYLDKVTVYDMNDKRIYDFPCERWLSGQDDDHRTYRVLPVDRERAFVDALEKGEERPPSRDGPRPKKKAASNTSNSESESTSKLSSRKDGASMKPRRSQKSKDSSSSSSSDSDSEDDKAVIEMSGSSYKDGKKEPAKKQKDDFFDAKPGTVIQFQRKGSERVVEEVVLDERGRDRKPQSVEQEYLAGYKAGLEAVEAQERKRKEEERTHERQLLSGPTIHEAVASGNIARVKELLETFPEMKEFKDDSGWTPLHLAAANGHVDIIKFLTASGRDDLDVETPTGYTPAHVSAMNGHTNALMVLHAMGADITSKTVDKQTPLHLASRAGQLECVKWLVANIVDISEEDSFGRTPLYLANEYNQQTVADFLRVCERDLADPNSTFAQMHRKAQSRASVGLPTIREDDKTSTSSGRPEVGSSTSSRRAQKEAKAHEQELKQKRQMYNEEHRRMQEQHLSFLDSIRHDVEDNAA